MSKNCKGLGFDALVAQITALDGEKMTELEMEAAVFKLCVDADYDYADVCAALGAGDTKSWEGFLDDVVIVGGDDLVPVY